MTLNNPTAVWVDTSGVVYVVETSSHCVRKFSYPNGIVSLYAGNYNNGFSGDGGQATSAVLNYPVCVGVNSAGVMYTCDQWNVNRVRQIATNGIITTIMGNSASDTGDGGPSTSASINNPFGVWFDTVGQIYLCSKDGHYIRRLSTSFIVSTIAGMSLFRSFVVFLTDSFVFRYGFFNLFK